MGEIQLLSAEDAEEPIDDVITEPGAPPAPDPEPAPAGEAGAPSHSPEGANPEGENVMPDPKATTPPAPASSGTGAPEPKPVELSVQPASGDVELAARIDRLVTDRVGKALDEINRQRRVADIVELSAQGGKTTVAQRTPSEKLGKLSPAERLAAADPEAFEEFCRLSPVVAPVNGLRLSGRGTDVTMSEHSFDANDLTDLNRRADLMAAAVELAAKDKLDIETAVTRLIGAN
jgi:hypothetical protein